MSDGIDETWTQRRFEDAAKRLYEQYGLPEKKNSLNTAGIGTNETISTTQTKTTVVVVKSRACVIL